MIATLGRFYWFLFCVIAVVSARYDSSQGAGWVGSLLMGVAWVGFLVVALYTLIVVLGFSLAVYSRSRPVAMSHIHEKCRHPIEPLSVWVWLRTVLSEIDITLRTFVFYQPWLAKVRHGEQWLPDAPIDGATARPVVLVHGYLCNAGAWHSIKKYLRHHRIPYVCLNLEPPMCSIDAYAEPTAKTVDDILQKTGATQVNLMGHSMGGLAIRAYAAAYGIDKIAAALTLGSPHQGTFLSPFGVGLNVRQMALGSAWLKALSQHPHDVALRSKLTTVWAHQDNIVCPQASATLPGARSFAISGSGHLSLLENRGSRKVIAQWLGIA